MVRPVKTAKAAIHVGLFLFVLLLLYLLNLEESEFSPELRENILSEYDYYMDEYNKEIDNAEYGDLDSYYVADGDRLFGDSTIGGMLSSRNHDFEEKKLSELVVVVVERVGTDSTDSNFDADQDNSQEPLETPSEVPESNDEDILRENDVMVDGIVIDRSDDLLDVNDTLSRNVDLSNSSIYQPADLIPFFKKPPTDRNAPGEFGHPFSVPRRLGPSVERQVEEGYRRHAFNVLVSDLISVHRNLGDKREEECKIKKFIKPLPSVSVVICFHDEALSTLLRTLYSVLESVPETLLDEIIVVDDGSQLTLHEILQAEIEDLPVVTMIRSPIQVGITQARILGVKLAKGDALVFLDSHCECYEGWLEPLLQRIKENRKVVALPIVDIINPDNFKFSVTPMQRVQRGGFDWTLTYRWIGPPKERFRNPSMDMTKPVPSPTMSGGVFAIDKKYFLELGNYDEDMRVWGGENLEMSFRVWMCGGRIEILPCSHVGHVYKSRNTHSVHTDILLHNKKRVAEVWLDNYKALFYKRTPEADQVDAGNLTSRHDLKKRLECRPFKWYIENVYPDLYVPELKPRFSGHLCCTFGDGVDVCLDTVTKEITPGRPLGVDRYQKNLQTQYFEATKQNELRQIGTRDICVDHRNGRLEAQKCKFPTESSKEPPPNQQWIIEKQEDNSYTVKNRENDLCLTASTGKVWLENCGEKSVRQKWKWK